MCVDCMVLVVLAEGVHPIPSRTRQLSPPAPMVPQKGRVGRRQDYAMYKTGFLACFFVSRYNKRKENENLKVKNLVKTFFLFNSSSP
jgi:hypothetical protein